MRQPTRRAVLGCVPAVAAGCSAPTRSGRETDDASTDATTTDAATTDATTTDAATTDATTTGVDDAPTAGNGEPTTADDPPTTDTTAAGLPFDDLSTAGMETRCLRFDYASAATTPVPSPTPAAPTSEAGAVELATAYERAYLRNWVVPNEDPVAEPTTTHQSRTPGATANPPTYPAIEAAYATRVVLGRTDRGVVVALRYERLLGGEGRPQESLGRYTVTYYLTDAATARAETTGDERPGPHPTEAGVLLACE